MATPLDGGLIGHFAYVFTVLLGFVIIYGVLETTKIFGDKKEGTNALVAIIVALFLLLSPKLVLAVQLMAPWFVGLFIVGIFILIFLGIFGVDMSMVKGMFSGKSKDGTVLTIVIILSLLIIIGVISSVFGSTISKSSIFVLLTNPKILGVFVLLLIGGLSIRFLTEYNKITK